MPSPPEAKPVRRRAILDAAQRLCHHYGHAKMTIADIAREASIAVGSVYKEFDSKESIIEELSTAAHAKVLEAMQRTARKRAEDELGIRFTAVITARTTTFLELRQEGQHATELVHCKAEGVAVAHDRFREDERTLLRQLFEDAQERGELAELDIRGAAGLVQRAFATLSPPWLFNVDDPARVAAEMCQLLLRGLLARPASASTAGLVSKKRPRGSRRP